MISGRGSTGVAQDDRIDLLQGTLDMLILRTLLLKPAHGHTIARSIEQTSEDVLQVDHGSLYPALHRLQRRGWIGSEWGASENNRRAKYYKLTAAGRKQLASETSKWERMAGAIGRILKPAREGAKS
jgi:PadR family transcriptional regulator PadR